MGFDHLTCFGYVISYTALIRVSSSMLSYNSATSISGDGRTETNTVIGSFLSRLRTCSSLKMFVRVLKVLQVRG